MSELPTSASTHPPNLISVIIPNLNGESTLGDQLEALAKQTYRGEWEVIISDNGSTDRSAEIIEGFKEKLPRLRVVDASDRRGVSYARNVGAREADGDFLAFCDNDDRVVPGWLDALAADAAEYDVMAGPLEQRELNDTEVWQWRLPGPTDHLPRALGFLPYVVSGNCGVHSAVLTQIGGWNEDYVGRCEDIEFSWRAGLGGFRLGFVPEAVVHYRYKPGLNPFRRQTFRWSFEEAHLYRDFRKSGVARSNTRSALKEWAWLIWHLPDLFGTSGEKGTWTRKAAQRWGRLRGSIRYRVVFL